MVNYGSKMPGRILHRRLSIIHTWSRISVSWYRRAYLGSTDIYCRLRRALSQSSLDLDNCRSSRRGRSWYSPGCVLCLRWLLPVIWSHSYNQSLRKLGWQRREHSIKYLIADICQWNECQLQSRPPDSTWNVLSNFSGRLGGCIESRWLALHIPDWNAHFRSERLV